MSFSCFPRERVFLFTWRAMLCYVNVMLGALDGGRNCQFDAQWSGCDLSCELKQVKYAAHVVGY